MIVFLCFFIGILRSSCEFVRCGRHEIHVDCFNPCQPSCSTPDRPSCLSWNCSPGCQCAEGFLRAFDDPLSRCTKCRRRKTKRLFSLNSCGKSEVFSTCVNPCQPSCSWLDRPSCPTLTCSAGCECRRNYFRQTNNSKSLCIRC